MDIKKKIVVLPGFMSAILHWSPGDTDVLASAFQTGNRRLRVLSFTNL
jgi:hypothetical protein